MNLVHTSLTQNPRMEMSQDQQLRTELGWTEVRSGLGLILRGWALMILAVGIAVAAIILTFTKNDRGSFHLKENNRDLVLFLTIGFTGLAWLYSYGCIIVGHWRCLMNAPERRGAKWLMFACLTCILAVPALNFASGFSGVKRAPKMRHGIEDVRDVELTMGGTVMSAASAGCEVLSTVLFVCFLRAVTRCFDDRVRTLLVDIYLVLLGVCILGTIFLITGGLKPTVLALMALPLLAGWVACFVGYILLLLIIRMGITSGLSKLRSPLKAY
jgi:hypothetical protein